MAQQTTNADYFGSFLSKVAETEAAATPAPVVPLTGPDPAHDVQRQLLALLAADPAPRSVRGLMVDTGTPPSQIVQILRTLAEANLVSLTPGTDDDHVQITDLGRKLS